MEKELQANIAVKALSQKKILNYYNINVTESSISLREYYTLKGLPDSTL